MMKRTREYKYFSMAISENGMREKVGKANQLYGLLASVARYRDNKCVMLC